MGCTIPWSSGDLVECAVVPPPDPRTTACSGCLGPLGRGVYKPLVLRRLVRAGVLLPPSQSSHVENDARRPWDQHQSAWQGIRDTRRAGLPMFIEGVGTRRDLLRDIHNTEFNRHPEDPAHGLQRKLAKTFTDSMLNASQPATILLSRRAALTFGGVLNVQVTPELIQKWIDATKRRTAPWARHCFWRTILNGWPTDSRSFHLRTRCIFGCTSEGYVDTTWSALGLYS